MFTREAAEPTEAAAEIDDIETRYIGQQRAQRRPFGRSGEPFNRARQGAVAREEILVVVNILRHSHCYEAGSRARQYPPLFTTSRRMDRSEEHTSELQSLMRISYAVFCLKKKK